MLRYRMLLGPLLIAALVGLCWLDERLDAAAIPAAWRGRPLFLETFPPGVVLFLAVAAAACLAARELAAIMHDKGILASRRITTAAALTGLVSMYGVPDSAPATVAVAVVGTAGTAVLLVALGFYSRHRTVEGVVAGAGGAMLAFVYLGLMFGFVLAIRREHSAWLLLWAILVAKSCDIGAYFTGKCIGRHKLILWLSPGKTWEGLVGGVVFAALTGATGLWLLAGARAEPTPPIWTGLAAGAIFAVVGQTGDLIASLFKRDAGIKDSSSLLPGFGGVLDVIDSPLLVAPVAYWWLHVIRPG